MVPAETEILKYISENMASPVVTGFMQAVSFLGNGGWVFIVIGLLLLFFRKTRSLGIGVLLSLLLNLILVNITLKPIVARPRPWMADPAIIPKIPLPADPSFPSGHTSAAFAFALAFLRKKKYFVPALILAVLMGISRVYLCVHYPTDVLGGAVCGIVCGIASIPLAEKLYVFINNKRS